MVKPFGVSGVYRNLPSVTTLRLTRARMASFGRAHRNLDPSLTRNKNPRATANY